MTPQEKLLQLTNLRQHWEQVCDAERRSQERNQRLLRELELLDTRTSTLALQAERLRLLKDQYKAYVYQIWPLWLEMQKTEHVPRSSTPKSTSNCNILASPESGINGNSPPARPAILRRPTILNKEHILEPTNLFRMPQQPSSGIALRNSSGLDVSSNSTGRPATSDPYVYKPKNSLMNYKPRDFLNSVQRNNYNKRPLTSASLQSLHKTQNGKTAVNNRPNLAVLKRNSFSGFPSSRQTTVLYPDEIVHKEHEERSSATKREANGVVGSVPGHVPISPNFSKLRTKMMEEKAERYPVKDSHFTYGSWMTNPLGPPTMNNCARKAGTVWQETEIANHTLLNSYDPSEESLNDGTQKQLPVRRKNSTQDVTELAPSVPINSKLVTDKSTETYRHVNSTPVASQHQNTSMRKSFSLQGDVLHTNVAESPALQFDVHSEEVSKFTTNKAKQHALESQSTNFNMSSNVPAVLREPPAKPVLKGQHIANNHGENNQKTDTTVFTNALQPPNDYDVSHRNMDGDLVQNERLIPRDDTNNQILNGNFSRAIQKIAGDFVEAELGPSSRKSSIESLSPSIPIVEAESLSRGLMASGKPDPVQPKQYHVNDVNTAVNAETVVNSVQVEKTLIENNENVLGTPLDKTTALLEDRRESVAVKTEESDYRGHVFHAEDTSVQLTEVQKTSSLLQQSDSESDKDSFFDEVKPSVVGSAAYLNLLQATDPRSQEAEDSDEVENELAARVAVPAETLKLDNQVDDPSTSISSENPDKRQPASQPSRNSPKDEQKSEQERKKPGWKMTTKEKLSALGMSVDSDSDVEIPHAIEAASDKDDFSF